MNVMETRRGALVIIAPLVIALVVAWLIYDPFHTLGNDVAFSRGALWLWVIGIGILGSVIVYGILRTRQRTAPEANLTQKATRDLYRREEEDRREQQLP
jgi:type VI protein secretion system component VasK